MMWSTDLTSYNNTSRIPDGVYKNIDTLPAKFWIKIDGDQLYMVTSPKYLRHEPINKNIYFSASPFPHITRNNFLSGTVFIDWLIPPSTYTFTVNGPTVTVTAEIQDLSYCDYQIGLYDEIKRNMIEIYNSRRDVVLFLSGGIDSMTILSFIISMGYLSRTRFVFFKNSTQQFATYKSPYRFSIVLELLEMLRPQCISCDIIEINESKIAGLFDCGYGNYYKLVTYCTSICENLYHDSALIIGNGNFTLLHYPLFINDLLALRGEYEEFNSLKVQDKLYSTGSKQFDARPGLVQMIPDSLLRSKMYCVLECANNNIISQPLVDNGCYPLLRKLDFNSVNLIDLIDVPMARSFIHKNVGLMLDKFITTEHSEDFDNNNNVMIPTEYLDYDKLWIPMDLTHNPEGLAFVLGERERIKTLGVINFNSIVSITALQLLHSIVN